MKDKSRTPEAKEKTLKRKQQRANKIISTQSHVPHNDEALKNLLTYVRRKSR